MSKMISYNNMDMEVENLRQISKSNPYRVVRCITPYCEMDQCPNVVSCIFELSYKKNADDHVSIVIEHRVCKQHFEALQKAAS